MKSLRGGFYLFIHRDFNLHLLLIIDVDLKASAVYSPDCGETIKKHLEEQATGQRRCHDQNYIDSPEHAARMHTRRTEEVSIAVSEQGGVVLCVCGQHTFYTQQR